MKSPLLILLVSASLTGCAAMHLNEECTKLSSDEPVTYAPTFIAGQLMMLPISGPECIEWKAKQSPHNLTGNYPY